MDKLWVITLKVFKKNAKSAGFWVMVLMPLLGIAIATTVGYFVAQQDSQSSSIAIISKNQELNQELSQLKSPDFKFESVKDEKQAQKQMQDEKIEGYLKLDVQKDSVIRAELYEDGSVKSKTDILQQTLQVLQQKRNAVQLKMSAIDLAKLNASPQFKQTQISFDENGKITTEKDDSEIRTLTSIIFSTLILLFVMTYFSMIAMEIAGEKGTRSMEIILSSLEAKTHFYGKILGMILLACVQFFIYAVAITCFCFTDLGKNLLKEIHLEEIFNGLFWWIIPFTLISLFLSMCLAALTGSLVSRTEDAQKAMQPFVVVGAITFYLPLILANDPNNIILKIVSYIPYLSAFILPSQLANGVATLPQVILSFILLVLSTGALLTFSASLYKSNVLLYSNNGLLNNFKQSWKNSRAEAAITNNTAKK